MCRPELLVFLLLLAVLNAPVLRGSSFQSLVFLPAPVRAGEWWRVLTHPFVHVTWYHLLLDGAAFLTLYHSLLDTSLGRRLLYLFTGAIGSLMLSWASAPAIASIGLCGLSGIAHGLMAVSALEMVTAFPLHSTERRIGWTSFGLVVAKASFEALSGRMFFAFLDFGLLGSPIAVAHAGGIVGSLLAFLALRGGRGHQRSRPLPSIGQTSVTMPSRQTMYSR
jgi:rhomboid family GlyGly-CTERM serine protease